MYQYFRELKAGATQHLRRLLHLHAARLLSAARQLISHANLAAQNMKIKVSGAVKTI